MSANGGRVEIPLTDEEQETTRRIHAASKTFGDPVKAEVTEVALPQSHQVIAQILKAHGYPPVVVPVFGELPNGSFHLFEEDGRVRLFFTPNTGVTLTRP